MDHQIEGRNREGAVGTHGELVSVERITSVLSGRGLAVCERHGSKIREFPCSEPGLAPRSQAGSWTTHSADLSRLVGAVNEIGAVT